MAVHQHIYKRPVERLTRYQKVRAVIEIWRREYNEDGPKKSLGRLTAANYAKQLVFRAVRMPDDSKALRN